MAFQQVQSPNCWPTRQGQVPHWLVFHGTAGFDTAEQVAAYFGSTTSQVSAHYVVGRDGTVIQCVNESAAAWANGEISGTPTTLGFRTAGDGVRRDAWWSPDINPNLQTISIEHVKPSEDNSDELTVQQINASFALINGICERWAIPKRFATMSGGITGHFSIDPINRSQCPGLFPWTQLFQYLEGGIMIPQGWSDANNVLIAPNNVPVTDGFRQFVLENSWDKNNWPIKAAEGKTPLQLSNTSLGGGTRQLFRWTTLGWTPNLGVFDIWTGEEIMALEAKIVSLETPPTTTPTQSQQPTAKAS